MAWIQSHQSLLTHRKTGRLARVLRMSRVTAVGHLHAVWWWCLDNAPDGDITDITDDEIAEAAMWEGEPSEFVDALIGAGFVDRCDGQTVVHDWNDYAGKLVSKRKTDAERKRRQRQGGHPGDVHRTSIGHPAPVTVDGAGREEKRREEKKDTPHTPQGALVGFDQFWAEYPNKVGKAVAQKAWIRIAPDEEKRALIMAGLQRAKLSAQWTKDGGQFIPHPSTWLNQQRWEDEYAPPLPKRDASGAPAGLFPDLPLSDEDRAELAKLQAIKAEAEARRAAG